MDTSRGAWPNLPRQLARAAAATRRHRGLRPLGELLADTLYGGGGRSDRAPHLRAPVGVQGMNFRLVVASAPVAALGLWSGDAGRAALLFAVALVTALALECLVAVSRRRTPDEGILLTAWLFALIVPPDTPSVPAAIAVAFGVVFGRAAFGGSGRYLVSPPLLALVFLLVAYPDAGGGAGSLATGGADGRLVALLSLAGAAWLVATGSASWRVLAGAVAGGLVSGLATDPALAWYLPLVTGSFAFGVAFIATDPTTAAMTNPGRLAYGLLVGLLSVAVGVMVAILFASLVAPLLDAAVVAANRRRRRAREQRA